MKIALAKGIKNILYPCLLYIYLFLLKFTHYEWFKRSLGKVYMRIVSKSKRYKIYCPANLKLVFPNKNEAERNIIRDSSSYQFFDSLCVLQNITKLSLQEVKNKIKFLDSETSSSVTNIKKLLSIQEKGILILGLHHHHWLVGPSILSAVFETKVATVLNKQVQAAENSWLFKKLSAAGFGPSSKLEVMQPKDQLDRSLLFKLSKFLNKSGVVVLAGDFNAKTQIEFFDFFGIPTAYSMGPFNLALLAKVPVFFASCQQVGESYEVLCYPIVTDFPELKTTQQKKKLLYYIAKKYVQYHETEILKDPGGSVLWTTQKRWKFSPPGSNFVPLSYT